MDVDRIFEDDACTVSRTSAHTTTKEKREMGKRLYVGNLSYSVTEADLREVFG